MGRLIVGIFLLLPGPAAAGTENSWPETTTPHFRIFHQESRLPPGLTMGIEQIRLRLELDLGMSILADWASRERIAIYLYRDRHAYLAGRFAPPEWSNGLSIYGQKAVAVPATAETPQLLRVLAHETTHLLFVSWFREKKRDPPAWLNEGLAMFEESSSLERPEESPWYQRMVALTPKERIPIDRFLTLSPMRDFSGDDKALAAFYVQAYSFVYFMVRRHTKLQFKAFCASLRDGADPGDALRRAYHDSNTAGFERRWQAWLGNPDHLRKIEALPTSLRGQGDGVVDSAPKLGSGAARLSPGWQIHTWKTFGTDEKKRPAVR